MKHFYILIFLFSPLFSGAQDLQTDVQTRLNTPVLQGAWWAGEAGYPDGETLFSIRAEKRMAPASTLKLITSAAALETFGPDHRFETRLYTPSEPDENGTLAGDLYVRGGGDPALGSLRPQGGEDAATVLTRWAKKLKQAGIRHVCGNIYADDSLFEGLSVGRKVNWENMGNYYAAPVSALAIADNSFRIYFDAQPVHGRLARVSGTKPQVPGVQITSFATADAFSRKDNTYVYAAPAQYQLTLYGTLPAGLQGFSVAAALPEPALFAVQYFKQILQENGITVDGEAKVLSAAPDYQKMNLLYTHYSVPLKDILYVVNKRSFNFYAEMLARNLAVHAGEKGTMENGLKQLEKWLRSKNIPLQDVVLYDASGLSRDNMLSARALTGTLNAMVQSPYFETYYNTLATPNDRGDLLVLRRFLAPQKRIENVRVKGGTIDGVKALAGYVKNADGKLISFAFITNNLDHKNESVFRLHENIIKLLLETRKAPNR